jgi:hypothetical protein
MTSKVQRHFPLRRLRSSAAPRRRWAITNHLADGARSEA